MNTFDDAFKILSTGSPTEIKDAKKFIEKKWKNDHKEFSKAFALIDKYIKAFDSILSPLHKSAVITGMSFFYLALADTHFDPLKDFIVKSLQDSDGRVREAARKTGDWLYISLSDRVDPFIYPKGKELSDIQIASQQIARGQYIDVVRELETLIDIYDDGLEANIEYIDDMKPSVNKSIQQMWVRLTCSRSYRETIENSVPIPFEILEKRKSIERDLAHLLKTCNVDEYTSIDDIKQMIFEEGSVKDMSAIIRIFDNGDISNLDNVLEIVGDAWNYFPHKLINGKCPAEMYSIKG